MLPTSRVHFIPAGKAPQRGADAVKVGYAQLPWSFCTKARGCLMRIATRTGASPAVGSIDTCRGFHLSHSFDERINAAVNCKFLR
jgi:hypothetical protein